MKKFSEIREARGDTCVFTFGRFNPPTIGHEKLIDKVSSEAKKVAGAPYYIFASHSENPKKDPLPYTKKVAYMKKMFPKHARRIIVDKARNVFEIAVSLHNKGHRSIVMVAGSDRVAEFEKLLNTYNGVEARHGYYGFDNIEVVSAGERDPDAEGVTGMSASKMRAAASENRYKNEYDERGRLKKEGFEAGLPVGFKQGMSLFKDVRRFMGIRESFIEHQVEQTEEDVIRDMYVEGEIFTIGEEVTDTYTGVTGKIIRRGTNYVTFVAEDGETYKKWLYEIELAESLWANIHKKRQRIKQGSGEKMRKPGEKGAPTPAQMKRAKGEEKDIDERKTAQDKEVGDRKGTQPKKYYAKDAEGDDMAKSTKQSRARHFEKGAKMDDDDPDAYKPAPGDKSAKTKPSKYTQAMKKKFPDLYKENKRIPRKKGQHRNSSSHSDLYTDENPEGTIKGLKFATVDDAKASVSKIEGSGKTHAHKIQAAIAMEQRAKEMGKTKEAAVYRQYIEKMKKKTKEMQNEGAADKSLAKKSEASGISVGILKQVYKRGVAAWRTGHRPGTTPSQWGHARVNSFISGGKTRTTADKDLWAKHKGKSEDTEVGEKKYLRTHPKLKNLKIPVNRKKGRIIRPGEKAFKDEVEDPREIGTDARRIAYQKGTPGQEIKKFTEHTSCCDDCAEESNLIESNVYRVGSEKYYEFFQEKRDEYKIGVYEPTGFDKEIMEGDLGKFDMYQGNHVPLDCPMIEERDVELNKPKVGGPKKYYVYVKDPATGNVKKVTFGDTTGLRVKLDDKEARKSFVARHNCENPGPKTKARYWSCNLPRYAKQLGLSGGGNFFW